MLAWTAAEDAASAVTGYRVAWAADAAPEDCADAAWTGTALSTELTGLPGGGRVGFRVCAVDEAGLVSDGTSASATIHTEHDPPVVSSLTLDGGAAVTHDTRVERAITASDATGIAKMCVATDGVECAVYSAYSSTTEVRLPSDEGVHTVSGWLEDAGGFRMQTPATASITLDLLADDDRDGFTEDVDCDDQDRNVYPGAEELCNAIDDDCDDAVDEGVRGVEHSCPAVDCAEVLTSNPDAEDGTYVLWTGEATCDMTTEGGGWTLVGDDLRLSGIETDPAAVTQASSIRRDEVMVLHDDPGDWVHAGGRWSTHLPSRNIVALRSGADATWTGTHNASGARCGMPLATVSDADNDYFSDGFVVRRDESSDMIAVSTIDGAAQCTIRDNPGETWVDVWVRRDTGGVVKAEESNAPTIDGIVAGDGSGTTHDRYVDVHVSAYDDTALARSCASTDPASCTSWEPYDGVHTARLPLTEVEHTVYITVEDVWGNTTQDSVAVTLDLLADVDRDGFTEDVDCDDNDRDIGPPGSEPECSVDSCAELLEGLPGAESDDYYVLGELMACDMETGGGGWTRVGEGALVHGQTVDGTEHNILGVEWTELRLEYVSGSVVAGARYPDSLSTNILEGRFGGGAWHGFGRVGGSLCGHTPLQPHNFLVTIEDNDYYVDRNVLSQDSIELATGEALNSCTTQDNSGTAVIDVWVR